MQSQCDGRDSQAEAIVVSSSLAGGSMSERIRTWDLDNHYTEGFVPMLKWIDVGTGQHL